MGLNVLAALVSNGVGFGTALGAVYGAFGAAAIRLGASLLLSAAANALTARQARTSDVRRQLALPSALPWVRYVYGTTRATGSPSNFPVRGGNAVGFWLLNSRPSDLSDPVIYLDGREITFTGDPFDFSGNGAVSTSAPFADGEFRFWIGRGDQTTAPTYITTGWPQGPGRDQELFLSTDAMRGCTVLWAVLTAGSSRTLQERWVAVPPTLEVLGDWSLVWDPRDTEQDGDDPATWAFSRNHALVALDALRRNPMRPYDDRNLMLETFEEGADICDEPINLKAGGTEPRWSADGTMVFDGAEIEDLMTPLMASGAADTIQIGGRVGYAWGKYRAPILTVTDVLGAGFEIVDLPPGDDLPNTLRVTCTAPGRGYETAELKPWAIPGAVAADGGKIREGTLDLPYAGPTQAMRARKRLGLRMRRAPVIDGMVFGPENIELVAGAGVTLALPAPFDAFDGVYEVTSLHPALDPLGDTGEVALRLPVGLVRANPDEDAWTPAVDEEDLIVIPYDGTRSATEIPLADLAEPADLGRSRYVSGWRGGDAFVTGDGYWWRDTVSGEIVTPARYVAQFGTGDYQIDTAARTLAGVLGLTRAGSASYIDRDGLVQFAASNVPRIDYSDGVGALLIEPAATNLVIASQDFTNAAWLTQNGTTVAANTVEAPDGTLTADTVTSGNAAFQGIYQDVAVTAATQYTFSFWVRLGTLAANNFRLAFRNNTAATFFVANVLPAQTLSATAWTRVIYTVTTPAGCTSLRCYPHRANAAVAGTFHLWGAQLETGGAASSFISTTTTAITRAADVPTMRGITATLDLDLLYGDGTTGTVSGAAVSTTYWPTLAQTRLRRLIGRTP